MSDLDLSGERVLIREDLNVPLKGGVIGSDARIRAALPTIEAAFSQGARVMVMSHLGRPKEGQFDPELSLEPVAVRLGELLARRVSLRRDWLDGVEVDEDEVVLLENVRFNVGEKANDEELAKRMSGLCRIFVMDAFGTAHRAQASTHGVARFAPVACGGPLLMAELDALGRTLDNPRRPLLAIVGGAKVSTKLTVLDALSDLVEGLIVGGGIANTFLAASGFEIGKSLCEMDLLDEARRLLEKAQAGGAEIPMPVDVVTAKEFSESAPASVKPVEDVAADDLILDVGPKTAQIYADRVMAAGTVIWNGPVGVFEFDSFAAGTETLSRAIAGSEAFSLAGGGDTLAAIDRCGVRGDISYISTGGGAFLEFLEGKKLPAVAMLEERARQMIL